MPHGFPGDRRDAPRGRAVPAGIQPVRRGEIRVRAQRPGARVHPLGKRLHAPCHMLGDRHRRVVSASEHQAVEHFLHGQLLALAQINRRAGHAAGVLPRGDDFVHRAAFNRQKRRHDLRGGGDRQPLVGVLFKQHAPGFRFQQNGGARACQRRFRVRDWSQQAQRRRHQKKSPSQTHRLLPSLYANATILYLRGFAGSDTIEGNVFQRTRKEGYRHECKNRYLR